MLWENPLSTKPVNKMALNPTHLLWLDMEMTGLFPAMQRSQDRLLATLTQKERDLFMATLVRLIEANNGYRRTALRSE